MAVEERRRIPPAPWRADFEAHMEAASPQAEFCFGTVSPAGQPHVRYCGYRALWACPPPANAVKEFGVPNRPILESDCPVFTTDSRMGKVRDIFRTDDIEICQGSGGGGAVEAAYWVRKDVMTEWRIRGKAWVICADDIESYGQSPGALAVQDHVKRYMRYINDPKKDVDTISSEEWSWKKEIEQHFANLQPISRGQFKHPPPGVPRGQPGPGEGMGLTAGPNLAKEDVVKKHFRLIIITPLEVERIQLTDPMDDRRWLWRLVNEGSSSWMRWEMTELWP